MAGSPSVCFDPEILESLNTLPASLPNKALIILGALEARGVRLPGNVHNELTSMTYVLAERLRARGMFVDGVHEITEEDHTSVKLSLISRGLSWIATQLSEMK